MLTDLSVTPIAEPLRRLAAARSSGDLQVRSGRAVKTIFFDHGRVVFAASNLKKDRLGEALVRSDASRTRSSAGRRPGEGGTASGASARRSCEAGVLQKGELGRSVARQVNRIVLSALRLHRRRGHLRGAAYAIPLEYMVSLSLHRLLYDGIKTMKSQELVLAGLGDLDRRVKLGAVPPFGFDPGECSPEELDILEHAQRRATPAPAGLGARAGWRSRGCAPSTRCSPSGVLRGTADAAEEAAQPVMQMETGTFLLSALQRQPDPSAREAIRQEVDATSSSARRGSTARRGSRSRARRRATSSIRALEEKMERYHSLLDAARRRRALKHGPRGHPRPRVRDAAAGPPGRLAGAAEPGAIREEPRGARGRAAVRAGAARSGARTGGAGRRAASSSSCWRARCAMTVSDYPNAIKVYVRLVTCAQRGVAPRAPRHRPGQLSAHRQAGGARVPGGPALDPDNADLHYQFGLYYKVMKQRARALGEMQTAVRLNPRHAWPAASWRSCRPRTARSAA